MRFNGSIPACVQRAIASEIQRLQEEAEMARPSDRKIFRKEIQVLKMFMKDLKSQNALKSMFPVV